MINPSDQNINVDEQQEWLKTHKAETSLSWQQLAGLTGIPSGTLSQFGAGTYKGDNKGKAVLVFKYRQTLAKQIELKAEAPDIPGYFETPTSNEIMQILAWAQRGRMTLFAGGPGTSKSFTAKEYKERVSNAWILTMRPSIRTVPAMSLAALRAMGDAQARQSNLLSNYIMTKFRGKNGVLIVDEAQHCSIEQIEELRSWHDETGVGIAVLGNEQILSRMEGGSRQIEFAQLYSRVSLRGIRTVPRRGDIEALATEWRIHDEGVYKYLLDIGLKPGGMRSCTFTLELARMMADAANTEITLHHMTAAWTQLSTRPIAA